MAAVQLFKRKRPYKDADGKEKIATNFYIKCGDEGDLIAIDIHYFQNPLLENRDPGYIGRKAVMEAFATTLVEENASESGS